ncbi:MAG TPA: hypothetical protein VIU12_25780 [Chryseolinea sp.]
MNLKDKTDLIHRSLSETLNVAISRVSSSQRKWILGTLGLCIAGLCIAMMVRPFFDGPVKATLQPSRMPVTIAPPQPAPLLSSRDRALLTGFKDMMDSLKTHDRDTYSKIIHGREGLLDSVGLILSVRP